MCSAAFWYDVFMATSSQEQVTDLPNPELRPQDSIVSFTTSRGSVYTYDDEGHTTRFKTASDKEQPTQDLTVFVNVEPKDVGTIAAAYLLRSSTEQTKIEVIEQQPDGEAKVITDIKEVALPDQLMVATFRGDRIVKRKPASIVPKIGMYVFDSRKFDENGTIKTERHLGHKVTAVRYKQ